MTTSSLEVTVQKNHGKETRYLFRRGEHPMITFQERESIFQRDPLPRIMNVKSELEFVELKQILQTLPNPERLQNSHQNLQSLTSWSQKI